MTDATLAPTAAEPPPSLAELQTEHARLQDRLTTDEAVRGAADAIAQFVRRTIAAGEGLDARDDRRAAQGFVNYWLSVASAADPDGKHPLPDLPAVALILPPAKDLVGRVAAAADGWLNEPETTDEDRTDREVARKIALRLVRLNAADQPELVTLPRDQLNDIQPDGRVQPVLERLISVGVVREGSVNGVPTVALRSAELFTKSNWLETLVTRRTAFRTKAKEWKEPTAALEPGGFFGRCKRWVDGIAHAVGGGVNGVLAKFGRGPREGEFTPDELREAEDYRDRNNDELRVVYRSQQLQLENVQRDRTHKGLFAALAAVLAVMTAVAGVGCWLAIDSGWKKDALANAATEAAKAEAAAAADAKRAQKKAEDEQRKAEVAEKAMEADAVAASTSSLAITALCMTEEPATIHVAKKLLLLQTLRQVLFARDSRSAQVARANWEWLEAELCDRDPKESHRRWFTTYLRDTNGDKVKLVLEGQPNERKAVDALRWLSRDLKKFFDQDKYAPGAIAVVSRSVLNDATAFTKSVAAAADAGRTPDECWPERRTFWRLDCVGLVLAADDDSAAGGAVRAFADALKWWEDDDAKASPDRVNQLTTAAVLFAAAVDALNMQPANDFYQYRKEQKPVNVPRK